MNEHLELLIDLNLLVIYTMYEGQPKSSEHGVLARLLRVCEYIFFDQYQETSFVHHKVVSSKQILLPKSSEVGQSKYM